MRAKAAHALFLGLLIASAFAPIPARAQEPQPGDPCPAANRFMRVAGPENPGSGHFLVCDGSLVWQPVMRFLPNGHVLFNSGGTPAAPLHVWGEAIIGDSGLACTAATEGAQRYDSANKHMEFCNGTNWCPIDGGCDYTPDAFAFTDQTGVAVSTVVESNTVTITGISGNPSASISGEGNPQFRIDGGSWITSGTIIDGQTLQLRLTSNLAYGETNSATVTVGTANEVWDVTTQEPCGANPDPGDLCSDGTYYVGLSPDGNEPMYLADSTTEVTRTWNNGTSNWTNTGFTSFTDGDGNTAGLAATSDFGSPYKAAEYCDGLDAHDHQDWYLPARHEINLLWNSGSPIGDIDTSGNSYWVSSEVDSNDAGVQRFSDGAEGSPNKSQTHPVRCVRR